MLDFSIMLEPETQDIFRYYVIGMMTHAMMVSAFVVPMSMVHSQWQWDNTDSPKEE